MSSRSMAAAGLAVTLLYLMPAAAQVPAAVLADVQKRFGCNADTVAGGMKVFALSDGAELWQVPCDLFAYNASAVFAHAPPGQGDAYAFLEFQGPPGRKRDDPYVVLNARWDGQAHTVSSFAKGRGLGDCGTYEVHKLVDARLQLVEYREKPDCDGVATPPEQYPLVYRAG
jgi:hypothetical protein